MIEMIMIEMMMMMTFLDCLLTLQVGHTGTSGSLS